MNLLTCENVGLRFNVWRLRGVEYLLGLCVHITKYMLGTIKHYLVVSIILCINSLSWFRLSLHFLPISVHSNPPIDVTHIIMSRVYIILQPDYVIKLASMFEL